MVVKFMALAFFLEALITLYVPSGWIAGLVGHQNPWAIVTAALFGVPAYTSNLAALPLISGLLAQGMNPAAALAFLISGPTTTLPAMSAVWGLASRRVFVLYVSSHTTLPDDDEDGKPDGGRARKLDYGLGEPNHTKWSLASTRAMVRGLPWIIGQITAGRV